MTQEIASRGARVSIPLIALLLGAPAAVLAGDAGTPMPDTRAFLEAVRRNLASDETLLENYTFTEEYTERRLDSGGSLKKVKKELFEVYPSVDPGQVYRRLVARDGQRLTEQELAEQDKKHKEKSERRL